MQDDNDDAQYSEFVFFYPFLDHEKGTVGLNNHAEKREEGKAY